MDLTSDQIAPARVVRRLPGGGAIVPLNGHNVHVEVKDAAGLLGER